MNSGSTDLRDIGASISTSLREHPFGVALLGMGLVWLVTSRTGAPQAIERAVHSAGDALSAGGSSVREAARRAGETLADKGRAARATVEDKAESAAHALRDAADDWADRAHGVAEKATEFADRGMERIGPAAAELREASDRSASAAAGQARALRGRIADALEKEPLLLAAGGLAIGAAIAATLPVAGRKSDGAR